MIGLCFGSICHICIVHMMVARLCWNHWPKFPKNNKNLESKGGGGGILIYRCRLTSIGIPILKIRQSNDHLIFNMEIPIPGKTVFILRQGPGLTHKYTMTVLVVDPEVVVHTEGRSIISMFSRLLRPDIEANGLVTHHILDQGDNCRRNLQVFDFQMHSSNLT